LKVLKFGGSSLKNAEGFKEVAEIIKNQNDQVIVILSGVYGVTNKIQDYLSLGKYDEKEIDKLIENLRNLHFDISKKAINNIKILRKTNKTIDEKLTHLTRLLRGVYYVEELTEKTRDLIISFGERLSVTILEAILNDIGLKSKAFEADKIGIITNGDYGNASAILDKVSTNLKKNILPVIKDGTIPTITGFFGCDSNGNTTLFGRNGSDYTASVIAYAVDADIVEIWKDVDGFLTADPNIIKTAKLIDKLSYDEAAELSYFGAKILHPRTVEPLAKKAIILRIKNTYNPESKGSIICKNPKIKKGLVKSVSYTSSIACIKIFGSGIGYKSGVLSDIVSNISENKINIISVITSQTCITLLLEKKDLEKSYNIISSKQIKTVERLEKIKDIALVCIVGEGINNHHGIAAKAFTAVAKKGINIEMISAGASEVAYYFIIKEKSIKPTIQSIHNAFFN
jgi:bifunctional aspartokinase / homoserine dehydrogenase 1